MITVRGKERFVIMNMAHHHYLRECELVAALTETQADLVAGRFVQESPEAHLARLDAMRRAMYWFSPISTSDAPPAF